MDEQQFFKERTEANIFTQIIQRYVPFWPLFVVTVGISLAITYIYLRAQTPMYVASAKVLLRDPNKGAGGDSKVLDALNIFSDKKTDNEILVLRSANLMQKVIAELDLYAQVFNEGKVRKEELYKDNSPLIFVAEKKDNIQYAGIYYFKIDWAKRLVNIDNKNVPFDSAVLLGNTYYRLKINPTYNTNVVGKNYFVQINSLGIAANQIIAFLRASALSNSSSVINVSVDINVPDKGVDILTKLFEIYNRESITDKMQIATNTLSFIQERLRVVTSQLDSVERNIARFKSKESTVDLGGQASLYYGNVKSMDVQNSKLDIQLDALNDLNNYIKSKDNKPGLVPALKFVSDPTLSTLIGSLYSAEFELDAARRTAGEKSESVLLAADRVSRIKGDIMESMQKVRESIVFEKRQLTSVLNENSGLLKNIPEKERTFLEISRQQSIKNSIYTYLLQKREETELSAAAAIADIKIIDAPSAYGPVSPVPKNFYLGGLAIGMLTAIGIILFKEQINRKVLFRAEVENKTSVPIIGEIIQVTSKDPIVILDGKRTVIAEQIRTIRTNLNFMGLNEENKTTLITSSISGEGKSFVAINLAISFTLTGKKVALLELDLRKPKLSKLLKVIKDPGITSYLVSKASIEDIIKETFIKDLYLISAGPIPPNPTELISSPKFKEMLEELGKRFDYIIMDTAPVGPVTDAQLLTKFAGTTIFVVRHNHTPKVFLQMIDDLHKQKKFTNMCIIFNGVKRRGISFSNYGYGGYGYGYGYGGGYGGGYYFDEKKTLASRIKRIFG